MTAIASELGLRAAIVSNKHQFSQNALPAIREGAIDVLCYTNARQYDVDALGDYRAFHMVRDPRDVAVSAYFSHLYSHGLGPWLVEHREALQRLDQDDGLLLELEFRAGQFRTLLGWNYDNPAVLETKVEDVTTRTPECLGEILSFLGIEVVDDARDRTTEHSIPESRLQDIIRTHSFEAKTGGRPRGQEDIYSHYRKGVSGDWKTYFREAHVEYFKTHYNALLIRLGYETSADW